MAGKTSTTASKPEAPADDTNDDVKATGDADQAQDNEKSDADAQAEKDARNADLLGNTPEDVDAAVEENPDAPEEAIETHYLVGGEVPVGAPGTEGMPRE